MPKITAPLLSFDARGQIAKAHVYSSWRGLPYVRRYVIPNDPRSNAQVFVRSAFRLLNEMWLFAPTLLTAPWDTYATGRPFLGRNQFVGQNVRIIAADPPETDMSAFVASPGARGGLPPLSMTPTPAANQISLALVLPQVPTGWDLVESQGVAFVNQAPDVAFSQRFFSATDDISPESLVITGLTAETEYVVSAWLAWTRPDGFPAYSVSLVDVSTTTA